MSGIKILEITCDEFFQMEGAWQDCIAKSSANPLFSSWIWLSSWWQIWQPRLNLSLLLLGVYEDNKLIGLVPCYTYIQNTALGLRVKRCEFIGDHTASNDSIRSEYLNFILPDTRYNELIPVIFEYFIDCDIDEVILKDLDMTSVTSSHFSTMYPNSLINKDCGIKITTKQPFESYLQQLGKNTRLKLFNRRKLLPKHNVSIIQTPSEIKHFFDRLNTMHLARWGRVCFSEHSLHFHHKIAHYFIKHQQLQCLQLLNEDGIQAVCYDIVVEGVRYNIQLGFHEYNSAKISMGTLMLGFAIEQAHVADKVLSYDLLAGKGKNSFYKKKLNGDAIYFSSYQIPLTLRAKALFLLKIAKRKLKNIIVRNSQ